MNINYHEDASLPSIDTDCLLARLLKAGNGARRIVLDDRKHNVKKGG
jgi:hypothetical protein